MSKADGILHRLFRIGVIGKGIHGLIELSGAILLYITSNTTILNIAESLTKGELAEDPNDILANLFLQTTSHVSQQGKDFAALYLFVAAVVNITLSIGLLMNRRRMFPIAIGIVGVFALYEIYLFVRTASPYLPVLILYDCVIIWLVYAEYKRGREQGNQE
ncbi:MAG: DUF2127 domain-containing protein [Candidatus Komeilibacteria bacterium]|nr:DUF2127 domain-containing protein [Candidatus Komeilibacteria bacterium]